MDSKECNVNYLQCQCCGKIYIANQTFPIDQLIVNELCPSCGYTKALNCGSQKEDVYLYMNESLDPRYYIYKTIQN